MLRRLILVPAALAAILGSSCAPSLLAPPRLVAAWPGAGASLAVGKHTFDLTFNRPLAPELSSAAVEREEDGAPMRTEVTLDPSNPTRLKVRLLDPSVGNYQLHWRAVGERSGEAAEGSRAFVLQDESSMPPRIDVSPATTDVGQPLAVSGSGFTKGSTVQLTIGDDEQVLTRAKTDDRGSFKLEAPVPASVPLGMQPVSAVDRQGRRATAAVQVRWGGWPPAVATNLGQPGPDAGEVTFTLTVRNRSDYLLEHVRLVIQDPDGASLVGADPTPRRSADTLVWEIPVMDRGVIGPFRVTYRAGTALIGHAWLEFRHRHMSGCSRDDCQPAFISESTSDSLPVAPAD
jgi:methionine-rich copper-binding protein CopC